MLRCDELPNLLITDVSMMGVTSLKINSSHHKMLYLNELYTIVTSDEFFLIKELEELKSYALFLVVKEVKGVRAVCSAINVRLYTTFCANGDKVLLPAHQKNQPEQTFLVRSG